MSAMLTRLPIQLERNPKRVITRLFLPGDQNRIRDIIERVCAFSAGEVKTMLAQLQRSFQTLHPDIEDVFLKHFEAVEDFLPAQFERTTHCGGLSVPTSPWNTRSSRRHFSILPWCRPLTRRVCRPGP